MILENTRIFDLVQELHLTAFNQSLRYRYDIVLGKAHLYYLEQLEKILKELEDEKKRFEST